MTDPKALIFDEPTANLDPESTEALASEIIRLKKEERAILVVDHRLYWLAGAVDRVIVMEDGRMAEEGDFSILTPELCRRYGLRSAAVPDVRRRCRETRRHRAARCSRRTPLPLPTREGPCV